jgi:uncharacterized protein (TIGR03067 family)
MTPCLILAISITIGAPAPKETPKEPPKLEGEWIVESFEGPKEGPPGSVTMRFTESKISIVEGGKAEHKEEAGYTVDLKKKPATIDIRPEKGQKEMVIQGIIEITGDTMKICFGRDGKERPKEFKGDAANGIMLINLKRVKAEK